jgi:pimeloyl-ACP methyl ester carboxylesterase
VIGGFVETIGLSRYALYAFDYGAPVGYRLAVAHPERVAAVVSQNGNAYLEGFSDAWGAWQNCWKSPTPENREACRGSLSPAAIRDVQYLHGSDPRRVSPDGYTLDIAYVSRPGAEEVQFDLILDYRSNVALYPTFQQYFREHQPPLLGIWGKNDPHFLRPARRCAFWTPATSRWKPTPRRSARLCGTSSTESSLADGRRIRASVTSP